MRNRMAAARKLWTAYHKRPPTDEELPEIRKLSERLLAADQLAETLDRGYKAAAKKKARAAYFLGIDPVRAVERYRWGGEAPPHPQLSDNILREIESTRKQERRDVYQEGILAGLIWDRLIQHLRRKLSHKACGHDFARTTGWLTKKGYFKSKPFIAWTKRMDKRIRCDCTLLQHAAGIREKFIKKKVCRLRDIERRERRRMFQIGQLLRHMGDQGDISELWGIVYASDADSGGLSAREYSNPLSGSPDSEDPQKSTKKAAPTLGRGVYGVTDRRFDEYLGGGMKSRENEKRHTITCEFCGANFPSAKSNARFCPRPRHCRQRALRAKKKEEEM